MGLFDRFKKKDKEKEELDILDEIKEPFSLDQFIEEQIVERYKSIRKMLDERGILFFLLSPFQYRNRLLLKLTAIFLGVVLGIVPRTSQLISQAQDRNAASELAQIAGRSYNIGRMELSALESSNYKKQHVLTFLIEGETAEGVPSTVDRYDIDLFPMRGVEDADKVKYHYDIIPIDNSQRMLIMYVDNRKQDDDTGIYGLDVRIAGDGDVKGDNALEIVLSDTQETTSLFDKNGIDLAILTDVFIPKTNQRIDETEEELAKTLEGYELMVDKLRAEGYEVDTDFEYMESYVGKYKVLSGLTDESTVRSLPDNPVKTEELVGEDKEEVELKINAGIGIDGKKYTSDMEDNVNSEEREKPTTADTRAMEGLRELQDQADQVTNVLKSLNGLRQDKYDNLIDLQRILERDIDPEKFGMSGFVEEPDDEEVEEGVEDKLKKPEDEDSPSSSDSKSKEEGVEDKE